MQLTWLHRRLHVVSQFLLWSLASTHYYYFTTLLQVVTKFPRAQSATSTYSTCIVAQTSSRTLNALSLNVFCLELRQIAIPMPTYPSALGLGTALVLVKVVLVLFISKSSVNRRVFL